LLIDGKRRIGYPLHQYCKTLGQPNKHFVTRIGISFITTKNGISFLAQRKKKKTELEYPYRDYDWAKKLLKPLISTSQLTNLADDRGGWEEECVLEEEILIVL